MYGSCAYGCKQARPSPNARSVHAALGPLIAIRGRSWLALNECGQHADRRHSARRRPVALDGEALAAGEGLSTTAADASAVQEPARHGLVATCRRHGQDLARPHPRGPSEGGSDPFRPDIPPVTAAFRSRLQPHTPHIQQLQPLPHGRRLARPLSTHTQVGSVPRRHEQITLLKHMLLLALVLFNYYCYVCFYYRY